MITTLHKNVEALKWFKFNTSYHVNINEVISDIAFETKEGRLFAEMQAIINEDLKR